jgi:hypothetical protein
MELKQRNIPEIVETERLMVLTASERYPKYYSHAQEATLFFSNFLKSIDRDRFIFAMLLSLAKKHLMLALLSTVRLHRIQAMLDLRQVLEAGASAAFAIANPEQEHFVEADDHGILSASQRLTKKRYEWLEEHFPDGSAAIRDMKAIINESMGHANIISAHNNFRFNDIAGSFDAPVFDIEDEHFVRTDLWMIGNIAIGLMDLLYGVNKGRDVIKFVDNFGTWLGKLRGDNDALHAEMTASERYKRAQEVLARIASSQFNRTTGS